jgi:hypothetical protein
MKKEEMTDWVTAVNELSESYADLAKALKGTGKDAMATRQLWRSGKRSWLIKAGLMLIAFPDPTISDIVGTAMVAAGMVQEGIKHRTLHVDDVYKTFENAMREVWSSIESYYV